MPDVAVVAHSRKSPSPLDHDLRPGEGASRFRRDCWR
jgi:hypothetical protein